MNVTKEIMSSEIVVIKSFIRGYHAYMEIWNPKIDKEYELKREPRNTTDENAVVVVKTTVVS